MRPYHKFALVFLALLLTVSCKEPLRDNQFDPGADNFKPLPPCYAYIYNVQYLPDSVQVITITFAMWFLDSLTRDYNIFHSLALNKEVVWMETDVIESGTQLYGYTFRYMGYQPWPVGDYTFSVYWGEFGVGTIPFSVVMENGRQTIRGSFDHMVRYPAKEIKIDTVRVNF
jgi:hypothetical protein